MSTDRRETGARSSTYALFGLSIATQLDLPARPSTEAADVVVEVGPAETIGLEPASGRVVADYVRGEVRWYSLSDQGHTMVMRLPGICDLSIAPDGSRARFTASPEVTDEMLAVMLAGTGVSTLLTLAGSIVLHGSAVARDGRAIGFLGDSGQGKSTLTSLLCTTGWSLVCDDVLRLEPVEATDRGSGLACFPGSREIRLREKAVFDPDWPRRMTIDGRRAVRPPSVDQVTPLEALVVPYPNREVTEVEGRRLATMESIPWLVHYARIGGWLDEDHRRAMFDAAVTVAKALPVWEIEVPWDHRLVAEVADQIVDLVTGGSTG